MMIIAISLHFYIFLAWDMVFKAIAGVATSQTGVRLLWKSSDTAAASTLSAKTTTTTPSTVYKSNIVENWSTHFIENVSSYIKTSYIFP